MNRYSVTLKHDKGTVKIIVNATDEQTAIRMVCAAEKCPQSAITRIKELKPQ